MTIKVIAGPPCSGKTTFIKDNASDKDIIIDLDLISQAFTLNKKDGHWVEPSVKSVAIAARTNAIKRAVAIEQGNKNQNVWIVNADPSNEDLDAYKFLKAELIFINPGKDVCVERCKKERPETFLQLIDHWYKKWENK